MKNEFDGRLKLSHPECRLMVIIGWWNCDEGAVQERVIRNRRVSSPYKQTPFFRRGEAPAESIGAESSIRTPSANDKDDAPDRLDVPTGQF